MSPGSSAPPSAWTGSVTADDVSARPLRMVHESPCRYVRLLKFFIFYFIFYFFVYHIDISWVLASTIGFVSSEQAGYGLDIFFLWLCYIVARIFCMAGSDTRVKKNDASLLMNWVYDDCTIRDHTVLFLNIVML